MSNPKKFSVEKAMRVGLSRTDILSAYKKGFLTQLQKIRYETKTIVVFKLECGNVTNILKVVSTDLENAEAISQIKEEYESAVNACNACEEGAAKPIDIRCIEDPDHLEYVVEILLENYGSNLLIALKNADAKKIMDVMTKVSLVMENLEEKKIFHLDLKPENIGISDDVVKIFNFGTSMITTKFLKGVTLPYLAPEVVDTYKGHPTPIDVYAWGMTLYQLLTHKSMDDILDENEIRKKDYNEFLNNVRNLNVKENTPKVLRQKAIKILLQVLSQDPEERPSFAKLNEKLVDIEYYKNQVRNLKKNLMDVTRERGN